MKIEVCRLHRLGGEGATKAFADIALDGEIVINGLRVIEGTDGLLFVSMPRESGKDGKWYNTVIPITREMKVHIEEVIMDAYNDGVEGVANYNISAIKCNNCRGTGYVNITKGA